MVESKKIKFIYKTSNEVIPTYVNGAFGGITDCNEILLHFFFESRPIANQRTFEWLEDGSLGEEIQAEEQVDKNAVVERDIKASLILTSETARDLAEWLVEKIKTIEEDQTEEKKKQGQTKLS